MAINQGFCLFLFIGRIIYEILSPDRAIVDAKIPIVDLSIQDTTTLLIF
jgi:hypothetical protein